MADNFRNKQWFKNMSQERKDEICKKFDIDEKTLKKCGRETEDGRIVIDILRLDHLLHKPELWKICYNSLKDFNISLDNISDIELCEKLYEVFKSGVKFLKYKDTPHNRVLLTDAAKYTKGWYNKFIDSNSTEEDKEYYAYQVWTHVRVLLETDLQLIKKS